MNKRYQKNILNILKEQMVFMKPGFQLGISNGECFVF